MDTREGTCTDFGSIQVDLVKKTRHLEIQFSEYLSFKMLSELESTLAWSAGRPEINAILLSPQGVLAPGELQSRPPQELRVLLERLRRLVVGMFYLPQTVVMNLGASCCDLGAELSLGADLRVAAHNIQLRWNHLQRGRAPCSGGSGILPLIVGDATARKWLLGTGVVEAEELQACGFLALAYRESSEVHSLLQNLCRQAPVARIQTKRALLENIIGALDKAQETEDKIAIPSLATGDYRSDGSPFCSPRDFARNLQKSAT